MLPFLHFLMVYLYGYVLLFCYPYLNEMSFSKSPIIVKQTGVGGVSGTGYEEQGSFPGFSAQDLCPLLFWWVLSLKYSHISFASQ